MIIAMDGPAGAGKSSVSLRLAERLGFQRLDTGALYRSVALAARQAGRAPEDPELQAFVEGLSIELRGERVFLGAEEITEAIRSPEISAAASLYAAQSSVRAALLGLQRRLGHQQNCVLDGRDIGTVVFPDAELKIFLTARAEVRAERRLLELRGRGIEAHFEQLLQEIKARDKADSERAHAPLKQAKDAVVVDASERSIEEVVDACFALVHKPS